MSTMTAPVKEAASPEMIAHAMQGKGEGVKHDIAAGRPPAIDYRSIHALMKLAMTRGHHRDTLSLEIDGAPVKCTIEGLYFRALLLARLAGGGLTSQQAGILDAWMWMWQPVLRGVRETPAGSALRADLDSEQGLQGGPRKDFGPSLYLPNAPLEAAHRAVVAELHKGNIVPASGPASAFPIAEHVAALDLIERVLQDARRERVTRAVRRPATGNVEILVGLGEILSRGFSSTPPVPVSVSLATRNGLRTQEHRLAREGDGIPKANEHARQRAQLVDESDSGFCFEGSLAETGRMAVGDLVGIRFHEGEAPVLCSIARRAPAENGRIRFGVARISSATVPMALVTTDQPGVPSAPLMFVPGRDSSGRHDGFIVSDATFEKGGRIEVVAESLTFTVKFNRVRSRGAGWVLAGYEVVSVGKI